MCGLHLQLICLVIMFGDCVFASAHVHQSHVGLVGLSQTVFPVQKITSMGVSSIAVVLVHTETIHSLFSWNILMWNGKCSCHTCPSVVHGTIWPLLTLFQKMTC